MESIRRNILLTIVIASLCSAADPVRTDREALLLQCDSVVSQIFVDTKDQASLFLTFGNDLATQFFRPNIVQAFTTRGLPVYLNNDSIGTTLELHVQESSVFYGEVFTETFFGERKCERTVTVTVLASLLSADDKKVIFSRPYTRSAVDTVALSMVEQFHSSTIPVTRYIKPELSFFDSVIEPAIVTVASGIVIYLFFTIRS